METALDFFTIKGTVVDHGVHELGDGWFRPWVKLTSGSAEPNLSAKATFGGMIGDLSLVSGPGERVVAALFSRL